MNVCTCIIQRALRQVVEWRLTKVLNFNFDGAQTEPAARIGCMLELGPNNRESNQIPLIDGKPLISQ